jgi:sulfate permease, SulP family
VTTSQTTNDAEPSAIRGDIFGGITAGVVALPLALGFGVASGLDTLHLDGVPISGALAGMIGAIVVGFFAALFGGTPSQVSGPTGPMTVVVAGVIAASTGDPRWIFVAIAISGVLQIVFGILKLGRYINYVPYPVISGFMSGIGVIIVVLQLPLLFGRPPQGNPVEAIKGVPGYLQNASVGAIGLCLATVALIYLVPRVTKAVPGTLLALLIMTPLAWFAGLDVPLIGEIPSGKPRLMLPAEMDWSALYLVLPAAFMLATLASIDSLLTSLVADKITKTRHDSERELIGQGIGNLVAGMIGGLPGAGATMRTVANVQSGGRGRLSGVVHSLLLLAVLLGLGPLAEQIPHAVLAGILITVGIGIVDYEGLKHFLKIPRGDALVMVLVLLLTVFVDLMTAVGVGLGLACIILVKRLSDMDPATHSPLLDIAAHRPWIPELEFPEEIARSIYVVDLHGSLFFGNSGPLERMLGHLQHAGVVVLRMQEVRYIDQSGAYALRDLAQHLNAAGTRVVLTELQHEPKFLLTKLGFVPGVFPLVFDDFQEAIRVIRADFRRSTPADPPLALTSVPAGNADPQEA